MLTVTGKAIVEKYYSIELDVDDITTEAMSLYESDELIRDAIYEKYNVLADKITVADIKKKDEI